MQTNRFSLTPDQSARIMATYFDPAPAPFNAYTYSASVRLHPSIFSKRIWHGELNFPAFSVTPTVSVQIISSISGLVLRSASASTQGE
jgi:hypothetical protein